MKYNRHSVKVIEAPQVYPVLLQTLKEYLRLDGSSDDHLLGEYIAASTDAVQQYCGRYFINTKLELTMDGFACDGGRDNTLQDGYFTGHKATFIGQSGEFDLPCRPIQSISSITTFDESNTSAVYPAANYTLDGPGGRVYLDTGATWPTDLRPRASVKIVFVAGYGPTYASVPAAIRQAILMHAGKMYECRDGCDLSDACKRILDGYRLIDDLGW